MANTLGALVVKLGLDAAEFTSGMTKAEYQAKKFLKGMEDDAKKIGAAFGVAAAGAATALFLMTKNAIDAADKMNDLSKATGLSVEVIGGLGFAAQQSGSNLEGVAKAVGKLNLNIAAAAAGPGEARQAFDAMGISVKDLSGNIKKADVVLAEVADKFASYEDGPNKAALGNKAFGKSYQEIMALLDEGGAKLQENIAYFKKYGGVTTEVAKQADEFNDTLTKLHLLSGAFARELAAQLLPSLQGVANAFVDAKEKSGGFKTEASAVAEILKTLAVGAIYTATEFRALGTVIGARAAQLAALANLDFKAASFIGDELAADIKKQYAARDALIAAVNNSQAKLTDTAGTKPPRSQAPGLPGAGGASKEAKQSIADYTNEIQKLKDALDPLAQEYPKLTAAQERVMADMQAGKAILWDTADAYLRASRALDEQAISAKEAAEAQKILDEEMKQAEAIEKRATDAIGAYTEQLDAYEKGIGVIGKSAKAYDLLNAEIEHNKRLKIATADTVDIENAQYERQKRLIATYHEANEALQQQIEYNRIFADSFSDALVSVVEGTKSVSDAFKDMARNIVHELNRIAAQNIAKALLGVNDQGGGGIGALIGKYAPMLISSLFSGPTPDYGNYATGPGAPQLGGPGGLAGGTDYWRGGPTWVGEHGPEIVNLPRGSQVIPFDKAKRAGGSVNIVTNITVPGNTSRATADQIGVQVGIAASRALRRNS